MSLKAKLGSVLQLFDDVFIIWVPTAPERMYILYKDFEYKMHTESKQPAEKEDIKTKHLTV